MLVDAVSAITQRKKGKLYKGIIRDRLLESERRGQLRPVLVFEPGLVLFRQSCPVNHPLVIRNHVDKVYQRVLMGADVVDRHGHWAEHARRSVRIGDDRLLVIWPRSTEVTISRFLEGLVVHVLSHVCW